MQARTRSITFSLALLLALVPRAAHAQRTALDRVDSLMTAGQAEQARVQLEQWKKNNKLDARATFLAARLATRAEDAEDAYLNVALSYATSPYASESLLRLGQARMAAGDTRQAAVYFQRLLADYPRSEHRAMAEEWLARTRSPRTAAPQVSTAPRPARPVPTQPATPARMRIAIQVGAFRERTSARAIARQIEKAGFENVRLVTMPENALTRVRVGKFENTASAMPIVNILKAAGFSAIIVSDAEREQQVRE